MKTERRERIALNTMSAVELVGGMSMTAMGIGMAAVGAAARSWEMLGVGVAITGGGGAATAEGAYDLKDGIDSYFSAKQAKLEPGHEG